MFIRGIIIFISLFFLSCKEENLTGMEHVQIAFISDVHLQDLYGTFSDNDYNGVLNPGTGKYTLARTMQSQLQSTRLFNENYFAFLAALDDVVSRKIKYVVLPGDFSDDGQMVNVKGLKKILNSYSKKYGIEFLITTGNHDPVGPYYQNAGKHDFLGENGNQQPIFSEQEKYRTIDTTSLKPVFTKDIAKLGYTEITEELSDFGFYPKKTYVYWETPFSTYNYKNYNIETALKQAELKKRTYKMEPYGHIIPDISYLVEPTNGLWFLAIDANVYQPNRSIATRTKNSNNYKSASIGYNNVLVHKKYLFKWIKTVTERAEKLGKTLIVFSHYPVVEFNDGATKNIKSLLGEKKMQLHRVPNKAVAKAFVDAGVKVHFGGHMHINDTGIERFELGNLINIQTPSLAAYVPAYKLLTIGNDIFDIKTIVIDSVPRFKELFPLYKKEYQFLKRKNDEVLWDSTILNVENYREFTDFHLQELVRLRFLKKDWDIPFTDFLIKASGEDLLNFAANKKDLKVSGFKSWTGYDMLVDLYRLRSADKLALNEINKIRLENYKQLIKIYLDRFENIKKPTNEEQDFNNFCLTFDKFLNGEPSIDFTINLKTYSITPN